ncbi:MAG TPA: cation-transporting P-type ATPase, partial [bacterium]
MEIKSDEYKKGTWFNLTVADALHELKADGINGLSDTEAAERLKQHGLNELSEQGRKKPFLLLIEQFTSTLVIILIIAAIISGFLGKPIETIAILTIVFLFAFL